MFDVTDLIFCKMFDLTDLPLISLSVSLIMWPYFSKDELFFHKFWKSIHSKLKNVTKVAEGGFSLIKACQFNPRTVIYWTML